MVHRSDLFALIYTPHFRTRRQMARESSPLCCTIGTALFQRIPFLSATAHLLLLSAYSLRRTAEADAVLQHYHTLLATEALRLGGRFYLPYRHHYTDDELIAAYPGWPAFCAAQVGYVAHQNLSC